MTDVIATPAAKPDTGQDYSKQLVVLVSGVFHAAYADVLPDFIRKTGLTVRSGLSPSLGDSPLSVTRS